MNDLSRRRFLATSAAAATLVGATAVSAETSAPDGQFGTMSLHEALMRRESIRQYTDEALDEATLSALLWAANGVNRPEVEGLTAPSWRTARDTDVYVAQAGGVHRFEPATGELVEVIGDDIRDRCSPQPFVAGAPAVLIYVSDHERVLKAAGVKESAPAAVTEAHRIAAHVNAAVIAQNVYLFCAASGLGTCLVGGIDASAITAALQLPETKAVTYVQPVGHPKG